jgi:hypothetical protein
MAKEPAPEKVKPTTDKVGDELTLELMGKIDDLTAALAAQTEAAAKFMQGVAGQIIGLEKRIGDLESMLSNPKAGAVDPLARTLLADLGRLFGAQRREFSPVLLPLARKFLDDVKPLVSEDMPRAGHVARGEKVKEISGAV